MTTIHLRTRLTIALLLVLITFSAGGLKVSAKTPLVHAVLIYRSTCIHCVQLVTTILPPIIEKYGDQLQIFYCDASKQEGDALFTATIDRFSIKTIGVPTIVIGNDVLIGSTDIENKFPGLIDTGLAQGGLDWPDIPGLQDAFATAGSMQIPVFNPPGSYMSPLPTPIIPGVNAPAVGPELSSFQKQINKIRANFLQDPRGNALAVIILLAMVVSLGLGMLGFMKKVARPFSRNELGWVPVVALLGMAVAAYLSYIELSSASAICGPVGHCQTVQASAYSRLFGVLPIGLLGLAGYLGILIVWCLRRFTAFLRRDIFTLILFGLSVVGMLFSIYLTFLEPFVIGASCLWCLTSATLMTALFLLLVPSARQALQERRTLSTLPAG